MLITLNDTQQVNQSISYYDAQNNPVAAPIQPPTWTSSDETVIRCVPAADGLSSTQVAAGKLGTASVVVSLPGAESVSIDFQVIPAVPFKAQVTTGTPEEQAQFAIPATPAPAPAPAAPAA